MSGKNKEELEKRIKDNEARGMVLVQEPTLVENLFVEHKFGYATLHKREFQTKVYHHQEKWVCKMRRAFSPNS